MRFRDLLEIVRGDLERNVRRTVLTMFGLIVGSAAVVAVTSIGLAGREYAVEQLESLGSNLVYAWYDGPTPSPNDLNEDDYHDISARVTALAQVSRLATDSTTLNIQGEQYNVTLVGTDGVYARVRNLVLREGRFISAFDLDNRRKVCVLSQSLAIRLFGNGQRLGRLVSAEGFDFQVVGVFRDVQSFSIPTELSQNAMIIPLTVLAAMSSSNRIDRIYGQAKSNTLVDRATQQMAQILAANHGSDVIYRVGNLGEVLGVVHRVSRGLILLVSVVSAISLLVGGVGIMNIMLVTVRERTPEIGLRKALGATSRQILDVFLLEAVMISVTGGGVGILLGGGMPVVLAAIFDVRIPVSLLSIILALAVSSSVGVFFGYYPAHRAARLNPVQALRYE
ncbi:MAG TPA: ABC transporter permease [Terriglobia bacterium]|nr:ABC transporter permease [Terriglobia bacterium]